MHAAANDLQSVPFLQGGGEMGRLIREKDWGKTLPGAVQEWPQSLRTTLTILLNSKFPMFLWWGTDLICFYNDAYRPSLGQNGKHPAILGQRGEEAWPEIWHIIKPLIDQVMTGGEAIWREDQLVPIYRNGSIEDVYWTFSYSPVCDESGRVNGVLVVCNETTDKINTLKILEQKEKKFRSLVMESPVPTAVFKGPDMIVELANDEVLKLWGKDKNVIGKPITVAIPELDGQPFLQLMQDVYATGITYIGKENMAIVEHGGELRTVYFNLVYKALYDDDGAVTSIICIGNDVTEQVNARKKVEESEKKFRTLSDFMPQHIWTTDADGNLNYYNQSVFDYSGLTPEEMNLDGWLEIIHPDDREISDKAWREAVATGTPFLIEHRYRRHDGEYRWQLSRALPVKDSTGKIQMWVGTSTDIDELKAHEQQKDDFIKMASHELKTPVTTIKGYVQLLLSKHSGSHDAMLSASLAMIDKHVSKLTKLITDLLDVTKIETGSFQLNKEEFAINELITGIAEDIQTISADHTIILDLQADMPVHADRDRIAQVLINLLTNAVKYSPKADTILVRTRRSPGELVVSVRDSGIGIAHRDQKKIFERFYRVEGKDEKTFPGFGIGLFIAKEIIACHNGKIWVESEKNTGSVFYFSLPV